MIAPIHAVRYVSVISIIVMVVFLATSPVYALENAYRYKSIGNTGAKNSIVTGNPTLRNDPSGKWSYMRIASQYIVGSDVYYIEVGWLKGDQPESAGTPRVYWTARATDGTVSQGWGGYPGIGTSYNYQVKQVSNNTWGVYFNNLSTSLVNRPVGWNVANRVFSGGETPNTSQGMGTSDNNNNAYLNSSGTTWNSTCGTTKFVTNAIYTVTAGGSCFSWSVSGNN